MMYEEAIQAEYSYGTARIHRAVPRRGIRQGVPGMAAVAWQRCLPPLLVAEGAEATGHHAQERLLAVQRMPQAVQRADEQRVPAQQPAAQDMAPRILCDGDRDTKANAQVFFSR
jgi:hypothetical protein